MAEKKQFRAIKVVRDILPPDSAAWNRVEQTAREVFESYGYGEIRLPIFEPTELFARTVGADTDIVLKEMYTFEIVELEELALLRHMLVGWPDPLRTPAFFESYKGTTAHFLDELGHALERGQVPITPLNRSAFQNLKDRAEDLLGASLTNDASRLLATSSVQAIKAGAGVLQLGDHTALRPEATASVCRAYIEHGMHTRPGNVKLYYIGPMFRRERPQKGRYRQFYQIGAEVLGQSDAPAIDAELVEMLLHFFDKIGLEGCALAYNSIGCRECRPKYVAALKAALEKVREKLGPDSQRRIETNPLRVLDSKVESEQPVIETLPRIGEHLCGACREHLAALREQFKQRGIAGVENWRLVRGLDYYTRTTFEITAPGLGSQNAVCGGGRFDGLVELLGGPPTKGIGFAIGTDRVMLALEHLGKLGAAAGCDVFVAWMGAAAESHTIRLARKLRDAGFRVEVPPEELKFRKSLDLANRLGARFALIIGENEINAGRYALKRLADGVQKELTEGELVEFLSGDRAIG
jgi:histidyl-tRNA synthetase